MKVLKDYKMITEALEALSKTDYIAKMLLNYNDEEKSVSNGLDNLTLENKDAFLKQAKKLKNDYLLLKKELESKDSTYKNAKNIYEIVSKYLLDNIIELCPNKELLTYYERLSVSQEKRKDKFKENLELAIFLRNIKIINEFYLDKDIEALERFVSLIETCLSSDEQITNVVYYALFDNRIIESYTFIKDNDKVRKSLLLDRSTLPDSIIKHICKDKQFKMLEPGLVIFIINILFSIDNGILRYNAEIHDIKDCIQNIFNNDINDFDSEAEFLDMGELIRKVKFYFDNNISDFEFNEELINILIGNKKLNIIDKSKERKK